MAGKQSSAVFLSAWHLAIQAHKSLILKWSIVRTSPSTNENWTLKCSFIQIVNYNHWREFQLVRISVFLGFRCSFHESSSADGKEKAKEFSIRVCGAENFAWKSYQKTSDCYSDRLLSLQGVGKKCLSINSVNTCSCLGFKWSSVLGTSNLFAEWFRSNTAFGQLVNSQWVSCRHGRYYTWGHKCEFSSFILELNSSNKNQEIDEIKSKSAIRENSVSVMTLTFSEILGTFWCFAFSGLNYF